MSQTSYEEQNKLLVKHIQHLFHDYEMLQMEHATLRTEQFSERFNNKNRGLTINSRETAADNLNKNVDNDMKRQIIDQESMINSLKGENIILVENLKNSLKRYNNLVTIIGSQNGLSVIPSVDDINNKSKLDEALSRCAALEQDLKELKEDHDFSKSEYVALLESSLQERNEWDEKEKKYEEALKFSKQLYVKNSDLEEKIAKIKIEEKILKDKLEEMCSIQTNYSAFIDQLMVLLFNEKSFNYIPFSEKITQETIQNETNKIISKDIMDKIVNKVKNLIHGSASLSNINSSEELLSNSCNISNEKFNKISEELQKVEQERNTLDAKYTELKKALESENNLNSEEISRLEEIATLKSDLDYQKKKNALILDKYVRHRQVFLNNESNFNNEIEKMDNFISNIFQFLKNMPDDIKESPEMKNFLRMYDDHLALERKTNC